MSSFLDLLDKRYFKDTQIIIIVGIWITVCPGLATDQQNCSISALWHSITLAKSPGRSWPFRFWADFIQSKPRGMSFLLDRGTPREETLALLSPGCDPGLAWQWTFLPALLILRSCCFLVSCFVQFPTSYCFAPETLLPRLSWEGLSFPPWWSSCTAASPQTGKFPALYRQAR